MRKKIAVIIVLVTLVVGIFSVSKYIPFIFQYFFNHDINIRQTNHKIDILLLGIGGGTHDGPNLTDTIIFASIDSQRNTVSLVSIPRDLWIPDLQAKINTAYAFGEEKQKGSGLVLAKAVVQKTLNQPVDYAIRIDFVGFVKAVDLLGGLDIEVENTFDDYEYPIEGKEDDPCGHDQKELDTLATASSQLDAFPCRYMHLHFNKGSQHMDGQTALRYVRSRHALGSEGTDFARSKRQEKIIKALKEKVFSLQTIFNPSKMLSLYAILQSSIDTDIKQDEYDDFARLAQSMKGVKIQSFVIDEGDESTGREGLLTNPPSFEAYGGQWVLIPKSGEGNYLQIQQFVNCQINGIDCPKQITPTIVPKK